MKRLATFATRVVPHLLFWPWNLLFVTTLGIGFLPFVFVSLLVDFANERVPLDELLPAMVLLVGPPLLAVLAVVRLRREPALLFGLLFGVELPVCALCLFRLFGLRELPACSALLLASFVVGLAAFGVGLLLDERRRRAPAVAVALLAGHGLVVVTGGYFGLLLSFFAVPTLLRAALEVLSFGWLPGFVDGVVRNPVTLVGAVGALFPLLFVGLTCLCVLLVPIVAPFAWLRGAARLLTSSWGFLSWRAPVALGVPMALVVAGAAMTWRAPHEEALARLAVAPADDAARRALLADEGALREGLLDAYLGTYRYLWSTADDDDVADNLTWALSISPERAAPVQELWNSLAAPFVYRGDAGQDRAVARGLYASIFDGDIERVERAAVLRALSATPWREQRSAGLIDVGARKVYLVSQDVRVGPRADAAVQQVELHDVWVNKTREQQEIFLHFSLPETAAVTGVWLGDTADKSKAFVYAIAPRGAAQQVYKEQVARRMDPALLEEVGPRQYRLRVFPIPPRVSPSWESDEPEPKMHVWLRVEALAGDAPLPVLTERRNGYWDDDTTRTVNGAAVEGDDDEQWIVSPPRDWGTRAALVGRVGEVCARVDPAPQAPALPAGTRVAVVVDRSFSMARHRGELKSALAAVGASPAAPTFFLGGGGSRGEPPSSPAGVDADALVMFGSTTPLQLLQGFAARGPAADGTVAPFDLVLVLTDDADADLALDGTAPLPTDAPIFLVHLGGEVPRSYDDTTGDALGKSGGGITTTAQEALDAYARRRTQQPFEHTVGDVRLTQGPCDGVPDDATAPRGVLARLLVGLMDRTRAKDDPKTLDGLQAIAVAGSVVTPYSSMIVLVNDEQRARLKALEQQEDRYQREVESGAEVPSVVSGAPEPEEWLLMLVGGVVVVMAMRRRRAVAAG